MMIQKIRLFFFLTYLCSCVNAQTVTFNKFYDNGIDATSNVLVLPDGYLTATTSGFPIIPRKMVLRKVDLNGDVIWEKIYGDSLTYDTFHGLIATHDGNYLTGSFAADVQAGIRIAKIIKFDNQGDTLWTKIYHAPVGFNYFMVYLIETNDLGFLITGQIIDSLSVDGNALLLKTDSLGNLQWSKIFGGTQYDAFFSSVQLPDKGYLNLGWTRSYGAGDKDWYLVKTDSIGNFKWQKTYGTWEFDTPFGITPTSDSNYILSGAGWLNNVAFYARLIKVDSSGTVLIQKDFTNFPSSEIWWTHENPDGTFISAGSIRNLMLSKDKGAVIKTDSNLNLLWSRTYLINNNSSCFRDVRLTPDGGYIASGFAFTGASGNQDAWLVKLDSLGCDSAGCATYVTGIAPSPLERVGVRLYPNPAKDVITISFPLPMFTACHIRIYDIMGKVVYKQDAFIQNQISIPVFNLTNGIYAVELNYEGIKEFKKFVKQ